MSSCVMWEGTLIVMNLKRLFTRLLANNFALKTPLLLLSVLFLRESNFYQQNSSERLTAHCMDTALDYKRS